MAELCVDLRVCLEKKVGVKPMLRMGFTTRPFIEAGYKSAPDTTLVLDLIKNDHETLYQQTTGFLSACEEALGELEDSSWMDGTSGVKIVVDLYEDMIDALEHDPDWTWEGT